MSRIIKLRLFTYVAIALMGLALSCKKSDVEGSSGLNVPISGPGVYVAGNSPFDIGTTAHIWKDGKDHIFKTSQALAMTSKGTDVYIAGLVNDSIGVVWKNGVISQLQQPAGTFSIFDIAVAGSDVYVLGTDRKGRNCRWKNGVPELSAGPYFYHMAASGNDIYMIGTLNDRSTCWKNGTSIELNGFTASHIAVSEEYVHLFGRTKDGRLALWKNGQTTPYTGGDVINIAAKGGDVYTASFNADNGICYEKNGVRSVLDPDPSTGKSKASSVMSIFVDEKDDLYLCGSVKVDDIFWTACYWKNGVRTDLSDIKGSIAVGISVIK